MPNRTIHLIVSLALLLTLAACGSSSKSSESDTTSGDTTTGNDTTTQPTFKPEEMIGTTWRFTELNAEFPAHSGALLTQVWKSDIRWCEETAQICCDHPTSTVGPITMGSEDCTSTGGTLVGKETCTPALKLIILMTVLKLEGTTMTVRAGSGDIAYLVDTAKATWYTVDPSDPLNTIDPAEITTDLVGPDFTATSESVLFFPTSATNKAIPIRKLKVDGRFTYVADIRPEEGCRLTGTAPVPGWIVEGTMSGVITIAEADELQTTLIPGQTKSLKWVLDNFNDQPNEDLDNDGTMDAYKFSGTFKARMVSNFSETK
ncbi:MAG: hypothetical protein KC609_17575 [Myxococcales bacterium]|nr:hypothetical protein [Myxococcales bacterium]